MYLFFDTETTGLPYNNPFRLVQLAWVLTDQDGNEIKSNCQIVKPNGFEIPDQATGIHRISTQRALSEGYDLKEVMNNWVEAMNTDKDVVLVAHNFDFDHKIVQKELRNCNYDIDLKQRKYLCTMVDKKIGEFVGIRNRYNYKWPTLTELYKKLFEKTFESAHDAQVDTNALVACFKELKRLNII